MNWIKIIKRSTYGLLTTFSLGYAVAQETIDLEEDFVTNIFNYGVLVNTQTTETVPKGGFELRILHRFGEMDLTNFNETVWDEFLGFDGSANIRFGFSYALSDRFQIGVGRTKINKAFDFEGKYRLWRQKETGMPISVTLYFNTVLSARDFPEVGPNEFFSDLVTPFEYKFAHRFSYNTQVLLSKKIGEKISLELNPTFIYKTLVPPGYENYSIGTTFGGRFKTGITSSILFEFTAKFNNRMDDYKDPISIGYEIGTAGHAFQMFISTTNQITEQNIYYSQPLDYTDGKLLIGFNIKRTFWHGSN